LKQSDSRLGCVDLNPTEDSALLKGPPVASPGVPDCLCDPAHIDYARATSATRFSAILLANGYSNRPIRPTDPRRASRAVRSSPRSASGCRRGGDTTHHGVATGRRCTGESVTKDLSCSPNRSMSHLGRMRCAVQHVCWETALIGARCLRRTVRPIKRDLRSDTLFLVSMRTVRG
jgi:hypothetical protein